MPQTLLAKPRTYGELTLERHLSDTEIAAQVIFKGRILQNWCRFFKVEECDRFLLHLRVAALFHDIGKANVEFYTAADTNNWTQKQALRHEWLSALILHLPNVREWLKPSGLDLEIITAAVLCHHLQAHPQEWGQPRILVKTGDKIELFLEHPEVKSILHRIAEIAGVEGIPELPESWIAGDRIWEQAYHDASNVGKKFGRNLKKDNERRSLLLAVKAGVMAADSVASGIFRVDSSDGIQQWVEEVLHHRLAITPKELQTQILQPRYRQLREKAATLGKSFRLKSFQRKAPRSGDRALLVSACGTGKTLFAYKWHQAMLAKYQVGHIIFLYPTRGTATEGFKDYVAWAPESDASLLTGTALYELKAMRENPPESTQRNGKTKDYTADERLFALGFWEKRFFSATVDQFLSFLTHSYSSICLLPVLADSVVVIDEVHSFSYKMFGNLISFLKHFDIPVLCMTATLPPGRKKQLEKYLKLFPPTDAELTKLENRPRYCISYVPLESQDGDLTEVRKEGLKTAYDLAISAYREGKLVLWVVNTVERCRKIAVGNNEFSGLVYEIGDENVLTYHSRFTLDDRKDRHQETVDTFAFRAGKRKPVIAVTTQVCEMSLDLDADVLITELAPIPSIVQRLGRSNRAPERDVSFRAQSFVYEPAGHLPYKVEELETARQFLSKVTGKVSQAQLAVELDNYSSNERKPDESSFITSGYWSVSESFRSDEEGYTTNAFLRKDLATIEALIEQNKAYKKQGEMEKIVPIDGYVVPVPNRLAIWDNRPEWMLRNMRYMAMADDRFYCPKRGFGQ